MTKKLTFLWIVLFGTLSLHAQWSSNPAVNNVICSLAGEQAIPKVAICPNGDIYVGYFSNESGNYNVRLQRLDGLGNTLWATDGILISNNQQDTWLTDWDMTADPANHAILVFNDIRNGNTNVYAYRIAPDGTFVWGANGVALSNNSAFNAAPKVIATNAGNIIAAWMSDQVIVMQKINPAGVVQWGPAGITISGTNSRTWPQMMPVGTDEFIMKYYDDSGAGWSPTRHVYAQKYNSSGTGIWSTPAVISTAGGISAQTQILPFISDNNGGFYIAWDDDRDNNLLANSWVQHINASGQALFQANGVEVSTEGTMNHWYPKLGLPSGSQEVYVFWNEINGNQDQWGIMAQKFSASGLRQWTDNGLTLIPVSSTNYHPMAGRNTDTDMVLFVEEYSGSINSFIKAMRVGTDGSFIWTPFLKPVSSVNSQKIHTSISTLSNAQWVLAWEDTRNGTSDIYAQNLSLDGLPGPVEFGTLSGTITLNGGFGNVTEATVQAGSQTTHPNASGFYTFNLPVGNYSLSATLNGYNTASQSNLAVIMNQTTTANLTLNAIPVGKIEGDVTILNGSGNVWNVTITAGSVTAHPDVSGHYSMLVSPGTIDVIASLPLYTNDTVQDVAVVLNQVTGNVDFELELAPTTGFIDGHVTLNGGSGVVTEVVVNAGGYITNPDVTGFYSMEVPVGNYDVMASLAGYATQFHLGVPVQPAQTTHNIDFILTPAADIAYITGNVSVQGSIQSITDVLVSSGNNSCHPDASGNYVLEVASGTYDVTASHDYTDEQTITGITVLPGQTATDINFSLNVIRTDLVCKIFVNGYPLQGYPVFVSVTGPEQTYTGTTSTDEIIFEKALYGVYDGEADDGFNIAIAHDTIDEENNILAFGFVIGILSPESKAFGMKVLPNPVNLQGELVFTLSAREAVDLSLIDMNGQQRILFNGVPFEAGENIIPLNSWLQNQPAGVYTLKLTDGKTSGICRLIMVK